MSEEDDIGLLGRILLWIAGILFGIVLLGGASLFVKVVIAQLLK